MRSVRYTLATLLVCLCSKVLAWVGKPCECQNGTPVYGDYTCDNDYQFQCFKCNPDYVLSDDKTHCFEAKECRCDHGEQVDGKQCIRESDQKCKACNTGYWLNDGICSALTHCKCTGGTPVLGNQCKSDNEQKCKSCSAGYILLNNLQCEPCRRGYTSDADGLSCIPCPIGTKWESNEKGGGTCSPCPGGTFADQVGSTKCESHQTCPAGTFIKDSGTSREDTTCQPCVGSGRSSSVNADKCDLCVAGYGTNDGNTACEKCAEPQYNNDVSTSACATDFCQVGQGFAWHNSTHVSCSPCPDGHFSDKADTGQCKKHTTCDDGTQKVRNGTRSKDVLCLPCDDGFFSNSHATGGKCQKHATCAAGTHEASAGTKTEDTTCAPNECGCEGGTPAAGTKCTEHGAKICERRGCEEERFFDTDEKKCYCRAGYKKVGTSCVLCPTGHYSSPNSTTCNMCIAGYGMKADNVTCEVCVRPKYNNDVSTSACATKSCPVGQGFAWHNSTYASCSPCPKEQFSDSNSTGQCQPYTRCKTGEHEVAKPTASSDRKCEANVCQCFNGVPATGELCTEHNPSELLEDICVACNKGYALDEVSKLCNACSEGEFQDKNNFAGERCKECPAGKYGNRESRDKGENEACSECEAGKITPRPGMFHGCHTCEPGKYQNSTGKSECLAHKECDNKSEIQFLQPDYTRDRECINPADAKYATDEEKTKACIKVYTHYIHYLNCGDSNRCGVAKTSKEDCRQARNVYRGANCCARVAKAPRTDCVIEYTQGECPLSCGAGKRFGEVVQVPINGGKPCPTGDIFQYCNKHPCPKGFTVLTGTCTVDGQCVRSPNYPNQYGPHAYCEIRPTGMGTLSVKKFETEYGRDPMRVNGVVFYGTRGPTGVEVTPATLIEFTSDGYNSRIDEYPGFEICLEPLFAS